MNNFKTSLFSLFLLIPLSLLQAQPKKIDNKVEPIFTLNPGVMGTFHRVSIDSRRGPRENASFTNSQPVVDFHLNLSSTDYQINENFGLNLMLLHSPFRVNRQNVGSQSGAGNYGTSLEGTFSYILPTVYYGQNSIKGYRIGFGVGPGKLSLEGLVRFRGQMNNSSTGNLVTSPDPARIEQYFYANIIRGLVDPYNMNPAELYLLTQHNNSLKNLELLGAYWSHKKYVTLEPIEYLFYNKLNPNLSYYDLVAIKGLTNSQVNIGPENGIAYTIYLELPAFSPGIKSRFYIETITTKTDNFKFELTNGRFAFYIPIEFYKNQLPALAQTEVDKVEGLENRAQDFVKEKESQL